MRSVLLPLIILMLAAGIAVADNQDKAQKPSTGFNKERVIKMRGGKFGRMFLSLIHKTKTLNLNDEQRSEVAEVGNKYLQQINETENESRRLQIEFMKDLKAEEFDAGQLKTMAKQIAETDQNSADTFIDGLSELRKVVGPENFAKLYPVTQLDRHALIQLREQNPKKRVESQRTTGTESNEGAELSN